MAIKTLLFIDIGISRMFRIQNDSIPLGNKFNLTTRAIHALIPNALLEVIIAPQCTCVRSESLLGSLSFENLHQRMICGFCPTEEQRKKTIAHSLRLIKYVSFTL